MSSFTPPPSLRCFIDVDISNSLASRSLAASFVSATDTRYGLSSKILTELGGSETTRVKGFYEGDHEWQGKGPIDAALPTRSVRIVVDLHSDVPLATENFSSLCAGPKTSAVGDSGKPMSYVGSVFHRIKTGFVMQGGDFVFGNGSGGESVHGKKVSYELFFFFLLLLLLPLSSSTYLQCHH